MGTHLGYINQQHSQTVTSKNGGQIRQVIERGGRIIFLCNGIKWPLFSYLQSGHNFLAEHGNSKW